MKQSSELFCPEIHCMHASWYAAAGDLVKRDEEVGLAAASAKTIGEALAQVSGASCVLGDRADAS